MSHAMSNSVRPLLVIMGPTASGKSDLAVLVAHELARRGQASRIITADAYQIYRGMDIGTAKPSVSDRQGVVHELLDIVEPEDGLSAHDWLSRASETIAACQARGEVPIVVGGTHLYIKLLVDGMFEGPKADAALRAQLHAMPAAELRAELERIDPACAAKLHPNDIRRTVRAIEVYRLTGKPISEHQTQWSDQESPDREQSQNQLVVLEWPTPLLNRRINYRVKRMMEQGLLEEVRGLAPRFGAQSREALGYKQLLDHLQGNVSLGDAVEAIKIQTRHFAKAQRTWLKKLGARPGAISLDMAALLPEWPWADETQPTDAQAAALLACKPTQEQAQRVVQACMHKGA